MVEYECYKCKKKFEKKYNYEKHINKKYSCTTGVNTVDQLKEELEIQKEQIHLLKQQIELLNENFKKNN